MIGRNPNLFYFAVAIALAMAVSMQSYLQDHKLYANGNYHNRYNNYTIFKTSFIHLQNNQDLYVNYNDEYFDLYKYSPTFAVFMAPFYYLPDSIGLPVWNLLNVLILVYALSRLPFYSAKMKLLAYLFIFPEVVTSMQNSQSNGLIAGLMVLSFIFLRERRVPLAAMALLLAAFIKPFALAGFVLFLFFPGKLKMLAWSLGICLFLLLLPLFFVSWSDLVGQYQNWNVMLSMDHTASYGISVLGWLYTWFNAGADKLLVLLVGVILLLAPLAAVRLYDNERYRLLMLSWVLVWVILFNHKSESSTFIIAVSGLAIWYFTQRPEWLNTLLIIFAFIFTGLIATDIFPRPWRKEWAEPYVVKVFPCILAGAKILADIGRLWYQNRGRREIG